MNTTDVLIIGGGPAGVSAALHLTAWDYQQILLSESPIGGLLPAGRRLENLPGFPKVPRGVEFSKLLQQQLHEEGIQVVREKIIQLSIQDDLFQVCCESMRRFRAKVVILATGTEPTPLDDTFPEGVKGEFIHRDITTMEKDLTGQRVAIVGSGDAAADSALSIRERGGIPFLLVRGTKLKCNDRLKRELENENITVFYENSLQKTIKLANGSIRLEMENGGNINCAALLACVGRIPLVPDLTRIPENTPKLLLAGDVKGTPLRYTTLAIADGAQAALEAVRLLKNEK
jgi:thioredoxin reductase (NADPH)